MDCKFCNAPMEDGQEVCPVCGKNVTEELSEEETVVEEAASENAFTIEAEDEEAQAALDAAPVTEIPKKKSAAKTVIGWLVAVILVLVISAGALVAYDYFKNGAVVPTEDIVLQGGTNYTVSAEEMTEEKLQTVVAAAKKNNLLRRAMENFGIAGKMKDGLTNAQLSMYYWDGFYNFYNQNGYYLMMMGFDPATMDTTDSGMGGEGVTQTWQEFFLSQALNVYRSQVSINEKAKAEGYTLSQELEDELAATEETLRAMEDIDEQLYMTYGPGLTLDDYLAYLRQQYTYSGYVTQYQENLTCTDEELAAYYDENAESYEANGIVKYEEGTEAEDSLTQAEAIYAQWQAGEATEESFAELATAHTTDPGSQETGGLYEDVTEGMMVPTFNDWCFDETRKPGDTGIVETDYGHHIMYFVSKNEDGTINVRHILLQSVNPDAWKDAVAEDYKNHKISDFITTTAQSYTLDMDLNQIALTLPGQMIPTEETPEVPTVEAETPDVAP